MIFFYHILVWSKVFYHKFILKHFVIEEHKSTHFRNLSEIYDYTCTTEIKYLGRIMV